MILAALQSCCWNELHLLSHSSHPHSFFSVGRHIGATMYTEHFHSRVAIALLISPMKV